MNPPLSPTLSTLAQPADTARSLAAAPAPSSPPAPADQALSALSAYDLGSSRAVLLPLDEAIRAALGNPDACRRLESRLLALLDAKPSAAATEYVCAKLALIGSPAAVPALARLLADPAVGHAARTALTTLPGPEAGRALRDSLPRLTGGERIGVLHSLGQRRDTASIPLLEPMLSSADPATAAAAAYALGEIGGPESTRALLTAFDRAAANERPTLADACLACAERLAAAGDAAAARAVCRRLSKAGLPPHIHQAARAAQSKFSTGSL